MSQQDLLHVSMNQVPFMSCPLSEHIAFTFPNDEESSYRPEGEGSRRGETNRTGSEGLASRYEVLAMSHHCPRMTAGTSTRSAAMAP